MANPDDLRPASNRIYLQIAAIYALIVSAIYLASAPTGNAPQFIVSSLLAWIVIGWCQFALFNALHEGLHIRFGSPHREATGLALTAWPLGFSRSYRQLHLNHHKYFGDPLLDPDYQNYASFPATRRAFIGRLLKNMSGIAAVKQFFAMPGKSTQSSGSQGQGNVFPMLATQLFLFFLFAMSIGWIYYLWLWLIPLVTFAKFFTSTRTFCEHASPDDRPVVRTITGSFAGEKVLGVFNFHYHAEHHRFVAIPCDQLPQAHVEHAATTFAAQPNPTEHYEHFERGYFALLLAWYRSLPRRS